ncbi:transmembrane protein 165-like isoform X2 [Panonychus citri]|uniref:transmembrane protein 165-like isoform X2 n=1 Tax=Panonychus citri TaxID=50023 RepID=UPI0023070950|nr:transmembrane protein 165-like isoform X2 [Panonychus citri]
MNVTVNPINSTAINETRIEDRTFFQGFSQTLLLVSLSEIGDKTFILTALMAMRHSKIYVLIGSLLAEYLMITLSMLVGMATSFIPVSIIHYISIIIFTLVGITMIYEGITSKDNLNVKNNDNRNDDKIKDQDDKGGQDLIGTRTGNEIIMNPHDKIQTTESNNLRFWFKDLNERHKSFIAIEMFTMVFIAEWADKSQLSIIILTTRENKFAVAVGAIAAQTLSMVVAVIGGSVMSQYILPKTVFSS